MIHRAPFLTQHLLPLKLSLPKWAKTLQRRSCTIVQTFMHADRSYRRQDMCPTQKERNNYTADDIVIRQDAY